MDYQRFDPSACAFPKAKVPFLPPLRQASLGRQESSPFRLLYSAESDAVFFSRGRYALTQAFRLCGVDQNTAVMVPAYHCRTMLDPAIRLGAEVVFYNVETNLAPDLEQLQKCLPLCRNPVKVLLVTHYFGFAQNLDPLVQFCASNGISLVEDCSHALVSQPAFSGIEQRSGMGQTGRFGVGSPYKFFPCEDGGVLWANGTEDLLGLRQIRPSLIAQFKGALDALLRVCEPQRPPDPHLLKQDLDAWNIQNPNIGSDTRETDHTTSEYYANDQESLSHLAVSRWVMGHTKLTRLTAHRRANYLRWADAIAPLPHCRALFPALPDDCVPYAFPLHIDRPDIHFFALKRLGVPVWRWDDMALSNCQVASSYRLCLLHLPCHQELSAQEMAWMIAAVTKVMREVPVNIP